VEHWHALQARPQSPERAAELAVTLEEVAAHDTQRAAQLFTALPGPERQPVIDVLLTDHAHRPPEAKRLAATFAAADPDAARGRGRSITYILTTAGEYRAAIRLAIQHNVSEPDTEEPVEWMRTAFREWAGAEPELAGLEALGLPANLREEGLESVAGAWAKTDPLAAIAFVDRLPPDVDSRTSLAAALRTWAENAPEAAAAWLMKHEPKHEFDYAIARIVSTERYADLPDEALALANRIVDRELRSHVIGQVLRRLAARDPAAARTRANASDALSPEDKAAVLEACHRPETGH
jgi:hypothetical protein